MTVYKTDTIEQHGRTYQIEWVLDDDVVGEPWDKEDGHGDVSEWTTRDRFPGEMVLIEDQGEHRFYDFQGAVKRARKEGWNTSPYEFETPGEQAQAAVMANFEWLRKWCVGEWWYCGIIVTTYLDDCECCGEPQQVSASLWGIEDDDGICSGEYHSTVIQDLIGEVEHQLNE